METLSLNSAVNTEYQQLLQSTFLASLAANTRRVYRSALRSCAREGLNLPATPLAIKQYLEQAKVWRKVAAGQWVRTEQACSIATLQTHLAALAAAHIFMGLPNPCQDLLVKSTFKLLKKQRGCAQQVAQPLTQERVLHLLRLALDNPNTVQAQRDATLLLIGYTGAFRRAELMALTLEDLQFNTEGVIIQIRRSKTDQTGQGRQIAIPYGRGEVCPVSFLQQWLHIAQILEGAVFRRVYRNGQVGAALSAHGFNLRLKQLAARAGWDQRLISAHSLRAGFCTSAAQQGVESWKIRQQTGHRSELMLMRYIRDARLFVDNPAANMW